MTLSICLLARNEEQNLGRALRSVAGLAEEAIVGDVASTDRTAQIAADLGARVVPLPWHDDFAAARNAVLEQATGDWALWLNPDEEVLEDGREHLRPCLEREDALAYQVRVLELARIDRPDHFTETVQARLFRRRADLRFAGRLHPHFLVPLEEVARRQGRHVYPSGLVLRHHAYASVLTEPKLQWAARLLKLELEDRPGQLHYLIEYGRTLLRLNDARGHEVLAEAAEQVLSARDAPRAPTPAVGELLEYVLTVSPEQGRCRLTPEEARDLGLRWFPSTPPVLWRIAEHSFQAGDLRGAARALERLVQCGRTGAYDRSAAFDPAILGAPALMNLGACYTRLGELDQAEHCFRQLLASPEHEARAAENLATVSKLRRQRAPLPKEEG